jgi:two-component system, chemotaxis family, sensor kinase CheA
MAIDMSQFFQVFFEESAEHLAAMETLLLELDLESPDSEQLNAIFRAAHSIKGSAGTFGFTDLAEVTHILENLLDRIRKHELALRAEMVDAFLVSDDLLRDMLGAHQGGEVVEPARVAEVCAMLRQLSGTAPVASAVRPQPSTSVSPPTVVTNPPDGTTRAYDLQFVPAMNITAKGIENFLNDLQALGRLETIERPLDAAQPGFWHLRLHTGQGRKSFAEQLDFIAESGAWRIDENSGRAANGEEAFGFFDDAPGAPDDSLGYGFFEPLPTDGTVPATAGADPGYGFFGPLTLPETSAGTAPAAEDPGYGFFEPLPVAPESALPASSQPVVEDGDGYGFFASLPVAEPVPVAMSAATPAAAPLRERAAAPGGKPAHAATDTSIRVSVEKVDQLINLVGELVITQAMLLQTAVQMQDAVPERLLAGLAQLERNTRDMQESVMSIRMLPISFVFSRFPRVVRDLSHKLGKQVELKTAGENTELDKGLIERIADPLTHLIRNSLDHGIEMPEQRVAAGKGAVGTITLKAYHQGGNVVIEVGDDGAGLNRQRILAKAHERGLPVTEQMSDQEVFGLIFEAGFSTAEQVTDVSGRGVGMDVVRRNIQGMGGRIEIESMAGIGTRMTVRLPLTLAILDGMSIGVGDQTYIVPLSYVVESLQPAADSIKTMANQMRVIQVRGDYLPVVVLHEAFGLPSAVPRFEEGIMVVLDADGAQVALFVDALLGQHQVVIKSLEANYRRVPGISGATIMGDGHVALILDVSAIVGMSRSSAYNQAA